MKRLSLIISDIYNKYSPTLKDQKIVFDLNVSEFDEDVADAEDIESHLDKQLKNLLKESRKHGAISLGIEKGRVVIRDSETVLLPLVCRAFSGRRVEVKSRVGFGTAIYISTESINSDCPKSKDNVVHEPKLAVAKAAPKKLKSGDFGVKSRKTK